MRFHWLKAKTTTNDQKAHLPAIEISVDQKNKGEHTPESEVGFVATLGA